MPIIIACLLILQLVLLLSASINIYPELFFFPWLVAKNWLPYRDFFDHHGFLLYYLLAPLSLDRSLFLIKAFYISIQSANLLLFLLIIKKNSGKVVLIFSALVFILLNFFVNENNFWFETVIAFFYLLAYFVLSSKIKPRYFLAGLFIALSSCIKPTAALVLLPLLLIYRQARVFIGFILVWILAVIFFYNQNGLSAAYQSLFVFNSKLSGYVANTYYWQDIRFLLISVALFFTSVYKLKITLFQRDYLLTLSFLFAGILFMYPFYGKAHLVVLGAFFPIWLNQVTLRVKGFGKTIVGLYLLYLCFLGFSHWQFLLFDRIIYQHNKAIQNMIKVYKNNHTNQNFWVMGNNAELYYYLDQLPPTRFPLYFHDWTGRFFPNFQAQTIRDLKQHKIELILEPKPTDSNYTELKTLHQYLHQNYQLVKYPDFNIYRFKTR